ncbi:MAG: hypothetical protein U0401_21580, partial [Anaerolineae bacterium]
QVEQALKELTAETRLAESKLQADQQRLERETSLRKLEAEFQTLTQEQSDLLQAKILQAQLARQQQESGVRLELEEAANRVKLALREREVEITRLQQEIRNLMNERDLTSRLVDKLPELAAHMPDIHELKVLQTGSGEGAFEALPAFIARVLAVAESLGLPLTPPKPPQDGSEGNGQ